MTLTTRCASLTNSVPKPSPGSLSREPAPRGLRPLQRRPPGAARRCIQGVGLIKVKLHRPVEGGIKTVTIKRDVDHLVRAFFRPAGHRRVAGVVQGYQPAQLCRSFEWPGGVLREWLVRGFTSIHDF